LPPRPNNMAGPSSSGAEAGKDEAGDLEPRRRRFIQSPRASSSGCPAPRTAAASSSPEAAAAVVPAYAAGRVRRRELDL
jgi:hypothetical protein